MNAKLTPDIYQQLNLILWWCFLSSFLGSTHGDFNQFNILIESDSTTNYWVTGVLDFGDTSNGYKICDLGIHIAHMMTHCHTYIDLLDITKFCLQGYLSTRSLSDEELQVLYDCVCGRLAMIAVMTQYYYSIQPDPYQIQLTKPACECLKRLWQKSAADALQYWLKWELRFLYINDGRWSAFHVEAFFSF